jgi:hypothetical protein
MLAPQRRQMAVLRLFRLVQARRSQTKKTIISRLKTEDKKLVTKSRQNITPFPNPNSLHFKLSAQKGNHNWPRDNNRTYDDVVEDNEVVSEFSKGKKTPSVGLKGANSSNNGDKENVANPSKRSEASKTATVQKTKQPTNSKQLSAKNPFISKNLNGKRKREGEEEESHSIAEDEAHDAAVESDLETADDSEQNEAPCEPLPKYVVNIPRLLQHRFLTLFFMFDECMQKISVFRSR